MIRCPRGYCCQDKESCKRIDSCNKHRTGPLCGKCEGNWTESLFSSKCFLVDYCPAAEIVALYIACVLAYGLGLMAFNYAKDVVPNILKNMLKALKRKFACRTGKLHSPVNTFELGHVQPENVMSSSDKEPLPKHVSLKHSQKPSLYKVEKSSPCDKHEKANKDDDAMKYVQILFYYVQDASLFKVQLPSEGHQDESRVVKILQFSPDILTTLYTHVSDMCFSPGTTAVTKVLFSSLFGPCIMVFIFLLYLGQKCLSRVIGKSWKMFRARLVQTYLLVVLFSYQKMVIGTFTMIQCVAVGNSTVLYIQGDIDCYTWWQHATEVYIYLSIVPSFFFLSHAPFYVEDKTMSVRMFILGCLLPVPVMVVYHVLKLVKRKVGSPLFIEPETDIETSSLSEHSVVSEQHQIQRGVRSNLSWNAKVDDFFSKLSKDGDTCSEVSRDTLGLVYVSSDSDTDIGSEYSTDLLRGTEERWHYSEQVIRESNKGVKGRPNEGKSQCSDLAMGESIDCSKRTNTDVEIKEERNKGEKKEETKSKFSNSRDAITYILLKHYRTLTVFGIRFTWLGVHKLHRVGLVACNTYITDPLNKLCIMSVLLAAISVANAFTRPYKDIDTNRVAILSYMANLCIAFINIIKVVLITFGCQVNCTLKRDMVLWYLDKEENVLLIYLPAVLVPAALLYMGVQKCMGKSKEE